MPFSTAYREKALLACARHCCICHKFSGRNMEIHHIKPKAHGGDDTFENAIPLCFNCHAEVGHYNPKHPKGIKYTESELFKHRDNWYNIVKNQDTISDRDEKFLTRVITGQELLAYINDNTHGLQFQYDEPKNEEDMDLISDFLQEIENLLDNYYMLESSVLVSLGFAFTKYIKDLECADLWVFFNNGFENYHGVNLKTLDIRIVYKTNADILQFRDIPKESSHETKI